MKFSNIRAVAISILLLLSVLSCDRQPSSPSTAAPAQPATTAQGTAAQETAPAQPAVAQDTQASAALSSAEGELPGLRVELQELKRTAGDTLTLKLVFVNTGQRGKGNARIEGHTDSKGSDAYNRRLSLQRAESVAGWLRKQQGLANIEYTVDGFGATRPVTPNTQPDGSDNPAARQKNRRVEIVLRKR